MAVGFGKTVCREWRQPDHGIWEVRGPPRHYTYSKLMCWVTLDCLIKLHEQGHVQAPIEDFLREREAIARAIEQNGYRQDLNAYVGVFGGEGADTALLRIPLCGYKDARDPKVVGTYRYIWNHLAENGLLRRYPAGYDTLQGKEGAFGVCNFWAVSNLVGQGKRDQAERLFEYTLGFANDLGLFAEEIDPKTGAALGNYPQAFTHVGLIDAAVELAKRGEEKR
jgi:GH15 family glucan-1,4-alpha-glucosidase